MSLCQLELGDCSSLPARLGLSGFEVFLLLIYKTFGNLSASLLSCNPVYIWALRYLGPSDAVEKHCGS